MNENRDRLRPRVLLVPNILHWILAQMSDEIRQALGKEFDFFIVPETLLDARPQLWAQLLREMDIVHCMTESAGEILKAYGVIALPTLTWIHHITQWSSGHQASCEVSTALVASTDAWKLRIAANTEKPIHVVRAGVDPRKFQRMAGAREKLGIVKEDFVVGFFGSKGSDSDGGRKGMDTFLDVARRCGASIPNLRLLLLGPGWERDVAAFEAAGIRVTYPGFIEAAELPVAYSALDVYLMTARVEGGPCTVLEAMACGTPVVATRVGLVPDVIVDGENGMSAEVGDAAGLAAAVMLLASDAALHTRMAENARTTAVALPWDKMLAPLADVYRSVYPARESSVKHPALLSERINRTAEVAEAILNFRYAIKPGSNNRWSKGKKTLRAVFRAARGPGDLLRGYRMAARGAV